MSPLGTMVMVKVRVIWRAERRERYFTRGISDCCLRWKRMYFGQTIQWMATHGVFHGRVEWGTEVDGGSASEMLSPGKTVFSRWHLLFNYISPWFYYSLPGDRTHFFVSLEIRLSWNRWIGKSLCCTENIVAVTIVAIEACLKWVRQ